MGHEQLFFFKYNFFDTLTSLATLLLYSHIAAMAIKMKRTLSSSLTEWFFLRCTQIMVEIRSKMGKKKNVQNCMAVNAIPISAYYDLVFPDSMLRSQCAISDTIFYNLSLQTHLRDSNCDQSALRSAAPRDALCAPSSPSADAPLPFPLNIKG